MVSKKCYWCNRSSFSASDKGVWICPYCGEDITEAITGIAK